MARSTRHFWQPKRSPASSSAAKIIKFAALHSATMLKAKRLSKSNIRETRSKGGESPPTPVEATVMAILNAVNRIALKQEKQESTNTNMEGV